MTIEDGSLVEPNIDKVLTQYRESPNLLFMLRTYLGQAEDVAQRLDAINSAFDLRTAVGDQLTLIGKRMGFPRSHCACSSSPVFGFCSDTYTGPYNIAGFCDTNSNWVSCNTDIATTLVLSDDELYRSFLTSRAYQIAKRFDKNSLEQAIIALFGPTAFIADIGPRRVVIASGRALTTQEETIKQLYPRVLPVFPGVRILFYFSDNSNFFGFGDGWGQFCDSSSEAVWLCPVDVHPYTCPE